MKKLSDILNESKSVAVVGISDKQERPSYRVAEYLKSAGYRIIPVNPRLQEVLGEKCYPSLDDIPTEVDIVDIFRRSEDVLPVVESAIRIGAKTIWMQEGIVNHEAAKIAQNAGIQVVMDHCMLKEHKKIKCYDDG